MAVLCIQIRSVITDLLETVASVRRVRHGLDWFVASAVQIVQLETELARFELPVLQCLLSTEGDIALGLIAVRNRTVLRGVRDFGIFQCPVSLVCSDFYGHHDFCRICAPAVSEFLTGLRDLVFIRLTRMVFRIGDLSEIGDSGRCELYARFLGHRRSGCHCRQFKGRLRSLRPRRSLDSLRHLDLCLSPCRVGIGDGLVVRRICHCRIKCTVSLVRHCYGRRDLGRTCAPAVREIASALCDRILVCLARMGLCVIDRAECRRSCFRQCYARILRHRCAFCSSHCEGRCRSARPVSSGYFLHCLELCFAFCLILVRDLLVARVICHCRLKCPVSLVRHCYGRRDLGRTCAPAVREIASALCDRILVCLARMGLCVIDRAECRRSCFRQCYARILRHRCAFCSSHCEGRCRSARPVSSGYFLHSLELCSPCGVIIIRKRSDSAVKNFRSFFAGCYFHSNDFCRAYTDSALCL